MLTLKLRSSSIAVLALSAGLLLAGCSNLAKPKQPVAEFKPGSAMPLPSQNQSGQALQWYLLGEVHDNPGGHQMRLQMLQQLLQPLLQASLAAGTQTKLVILMEQFDFEQQDQLDQAQRLCRDANCLLQLLQTQQTPQTPQTPSGKTAAGNANPGAAGSNWHWPHYLPLIQYALDHKIPLRAANLSRQQARKVIREGYAAVLSPAQLQRWQLRPEQAMTVHQELHQAQQQQVLLAHCQQVPAGLAAQMAQAQIARDLLMAETLLQQTSGAILLAGNGHVRKDLGVPYWLNFAARHSPTQSPQLSQNQPRDLSQHPWYSVAYLESAAASADYADQIIAIPVHTRADPCASFTSSQPATSSSDTATTASSKPSSAINPAATSTKEKS